MSLEAWKAFFEIGGVVLLLLTFAFGAGALIVNNRLSTIQAKELGDFRIKFEQEQQKTALAQREAAEAKKIAGGFERDISTANQRAAEANAKAEGFRRDIANADERTATLEVEALTLRKQLLEQGPRANLVTGDNRRKLVDALKPFSGQKIDVRHSASVSMVNSRIVQSTPIGDDALPLANALTAVLKDAGWNIPSKALPSKLAGQGITVEIVPKASQHTKATAEALVEALKKVPLTVSGPTEVTDELAKRVSEDVIQPEFGENTIVLDVLTHQ